MKVFIKATLTGNAMPWPAWIHRIAYARYRRAAFTDRQGDAVAANPRYSWTGCGHIARQ